MASVLWLGYILHVWILGPFGIGVDRSSLFNVVHYPGAYFGAIGGSLGGLLSTP